GASRCSPGSRRCADAPSPAGAASAGGGESRRAGWRCAVVGGGAVAPLRVGPPVAPPVPAPAFGLALGRRAGLGRSHLLAMGGCHPERALARDPPVLPRPALSLHARAD